MVGKMFHHLILYYACISFLSNRNNSLIEKTDFLLELTLFTNFSTFQIAVYKFNARKGNLKISPKLSSENTEILIFCYWSRVNFIRSNKLIGSISSLYPGTAMRTKVYMPVCIPPPSCLVWCDCSGEGSRSWKELFLFPAFPNSRRLRISDSNVVNLTE